MTKTNAGWILVLDRDQARLLRATRTAHDRVHLDEVAQLRSTFQAGEHQRATQLAPGRNAPVSHEREEGLHHFAREVAAWMPREFATHGIEQCTAFAPTHMLGALKPELPAALAARVPMHAGELAQTELGQLARHPRVLEVLSNQRA